MQIDIPPRRERIADIERLTEYFIATFNSKMNLNVLGTTEEVRAIFESYDWPGNVRELRNIIEGAFNIIGSRIIQVENLPSYLTRRYEAEQEKITAQSGNMSLAEKVDAYERRLIVHALDSTHSISEAAEKLKMSKQALNYKLNKYGLR